MTTTTKKDTTVAKKKTKRHKRKLKTPPKQLVLDCIKSIKQRNFGSVLVFGQDEFTDIFLEEAMKSKIPMVMFSDMNNDKASHMNKLLARYNGSALRTSYVHKQEALKEAWAEVLIFGSTESAQEYAAIVSELPYEEIFVLEEF